MKRIDAAFDDARPLTADSSRPVTGYFWSHDARYVLFVQDRAGNENFRVYAVDPTAPAEAATGVPPARDLTPYENIRAAIYGPRASPSRKRFRWGWRRKPKNFRNRAARCIAKN